MSKEVIYIDTNDDITSLISKIKASPEKIIALVPSKQISLLQSSVNLKLLAKTTKANDKYLVVITNNQALKKLAALARVPIAATLQSKPELPEIDALKVDGESDIITSDAPEPELGAKAAAAPIAGKKLADSAAPKKPVKVPNHKKFQKKVLLIAGGAVALVLFLIWAIVLAPNAQITIASTKKTENVTANLKLSEDSTATNVDNGILHFQTQRLTKQRSIEFNATGDKEIGSKATGTITLEKYQGSNPATIPAGTAFSSNSLNFITVSDVTVPGTGETEDGNNVPGRASVKVQAQDIGDQYNLSAREYLSSIRNVKATGTDMAGGSKRQVKVVTQKDLDTAKQALEKQSSDEAKTELTNKFDSSVVVIQESLQTKAGDIKASNEVDSEAKDGKARLEQEVEYSISAVSRDLLKQFIEAAAKSQEVEAKLGDNQRIFDHGLDTIQFNKYQATSNPASAEVVVQIQIGPNIDEASVREFAGGKAVGEIQSHYQSIEGVSSVNVQVKPFWVSRVPKNPSKINVKIELK